MLKNRDYNLRKNYKEREILDNTFKSLSLNNLVSSQTKRAARKALFASRSKNSQSKIKNRCIVSNNTRAVQKLWGLNRHNLKRYANIAHIPGLRRI